MKQKNNITLLVIGVLTLLVAIVGAAYAYFSSSITPGSGLNLDVEAQANTAQFTASGGQFGFTVTGAEMQQANAGSLAKEATGSINVSLTSPKIAMCTFDVAFAWNSGSSYTATSGRGSQFEFGVLYEGNPYGAINNAIKPINFDTLISGGGKVLEDAKIIINEANGTSKTTNITLNFKVQMYNLNHDQSALAGSGNKTYSGRFYVTNVDCQENKLYLNDVILASNEIYPDNVASTHVSSPAGINFDYPSSNTNGKGVYYTNQNTENNDYTYYFRGDLENNYVEFGDYTDDLILLKGQNEERNGLWSYVGDQEECNWRFYNCTQVTFSAGDNIVWRIIGINEDGSVRLMTEYPIGQSSFYDACEMVDETTWSCPENSNEYVGSTIQSFIDAWYETNIMGYSHLLSNYGYKLGDDVYTAYNSDRGNRLLDYNIGLLTLQNMIYLGAQENAETYTNNYLKNMGEFWIMDSSDIIQEDGALTAYFSHYGGYYYSSIPNSMDVRPVINLRSDIKITGGTGTVTNPYIINLD